MNNNTINASTQEEDTDNNALDFAPPTPRILPTIVGEGHTLSTVSGLTQLPAVMNPQTLQEIMRAISTNPAPRAGEEILSESNSDMSEFELDTIPPYSEHGSASSSSDSDTSTGSICELCSRRFKKVIFLNCTHGACVSCTKKLWWSRIEHEVHWPDSFPCPYCRANTDRVSDSSDKVVGIPIVPWMLRKSSSAGARFSQSSPNSSNRDVRLFRVGVMLDANERFYD